MVLRTQLVNLGKTSSPVLIGVYTSRSKAETFASVGLEWGIQELYGQLPLAADPGAHTKTAVLSVCLACKPLLLTGNSL